MGFSPSINSVIILLELWLLFMVLLHLPCCCLLANKAVDRIHLDELKAGNEKVKETKASCGRFLLVPQQAVKLDDELIFFLCEVSPLKIRPQVIDPAKPAALPAAEQPGRLWQRPPAPFAVSPDICNQAIIFFLGPCTLVGVSLFTTRGPPHSWRKRRRKLSIARARKQRSKGWLLEDL